MSVREDSLSSSARTLGLSALICVPQQSLQRYHLHIHYFISVFWPCMTLRKFGCLKSKIKRNVECKNPRVVGPSDLIQKPLSSHAQSSPWCKTSPQGSAPLSEFENEASMVGLCRSNFLFGSIYGLWATLISYNCLFNFRWCWPLLEHSIQESSDFCLSVNLLCTYTHTHPFPSCPVTHYSYIFNKPPVQVKIS